MNAYHPVPAGTDLLTSESTAADAVREILTLDDIAAGSVLLLVCDEPDGPIVPVVINDVPTDSPSGGAIERWFSQLWAHFPEGDRPDLIFARARLGQSFILDRDREWHDAIARACAREGVVLHWAFVVTQHAVIPFPASVSTQS